MRCCYRHNIWRTRNRPIKKMGGDATSVPGEIEEPIYKTWEEFMAMGDDSTPVVAALNEDPTGYINALEGHVFSGTMDDRGGIEGLSITMYILFDSVPQVTLPLEAEDEEEFFSKLHFWDSDVIQMVTVQNPERFPQEMLAEFFPEGYTWGMRYAQYPG